MRQMVLGTVCLFLASTATQVERDVNRYAFAAPHMGTEFRIVLYADGEARAADAAQAAFTRVAELEALLSDYRDDSELTRLGHHAAGDPVHVSDDLFRVLSHAQGIARASGGAFDPTIGPLTRLWRRARRTNEFPQQRDIEAAREAVGYDRLALDETTRTVRLTRTGIRLDVGGIGKGFAADDAAAVLKRHRIDRALIAAGGDIVAIGRPPDADGWTVAVASLDSPGGQARRIQLRDEAVSTSGDREQWFERGGVRYSHIIDPRTGWPVIGMTSVTVVARAGADADAIATAVAVLGPEEGLKLIEGSDDAAALVQRARGERVETFMSRCWRFAEGAVGGRAIGCR